MLLLWFYFVDPDCISIFLHIASIHVTLSLLRSVCLVCCALFLRLTLTSTPQDVRNFHYAIYFNLYFSYWFFNEHAMPFISAMCIIFHDHNNDRVPVTETEKATTRTKINVRSRHRHRPITLHFEPLVLQYRLVYTLHACPNDFHEMPMTIVDRPLIDYSYHCYAGLFSVRMFAFTICVWSIMSVLCAIISQLISIVQYSHERRMNQSKKCRPLNQLVHLGEYFLISNLAVRCQPVAIIFGYSLSVLLNVWILHNNLTRLSFSPFQILLCKLQLWNRSTF